MVPRVGVVGSGVVGSPSSCPLLRARAEPTWASGFNTPRATRGHSEPSHSTIYWQNLKEIWSREGEDA